ncbi:hypothetical protein GAY28_07305 [Azospirillum brasilense]|nr:hypothetical protein [Azospirillum brasilense]
MADIELLDRVIRLAELAQDAAPEVRDQIVLTLKWINCPVATVDGFGVNLRDSTEGDPVKLAEMRRATRRADLHDLPACDCGARPGLRHLEGCARLEAARATGLAALRMDVTVDLGVAVAEGAEALHGAPQAAAGP